MLALNRDGKLNCGFASIKGGFSSKSLHFDSTNRRCTNSIGFAQSNSSITRQFNIVPNDTFTLESIEYINDPTAVLAQIPDFTTNWTYTNGSSVQQSLSTSFGERAKRTSNFTNQTSITTKLSTTVEVKVPFIANGKISTEVGGSSQNTYGKSEEREDSRT